ncbi:unnamed protein product [Pleuronectes platessa]|uniref:Uncharacterized protein n=1 Tax=Pleuronectes platessa TaxID=8262 RepID=A0A9N7UY12_PLEPL|nr:unnamed protein product [Pleuronectes platessa]
MSPAPLINTDSLNQWLAGQPKALAAPPSSLPPTTTTLPCRSQSSPQIESQVVGSKVAVCGDRLWVIEALTRWGWGGGSGAGDGRLVWCLEKGNGFPLGNVCREIPRKVLPRRDGLDSLKEDEDMEGQAGRNGDCQLS